MRSFITLLLSGTLALAGCTKPEPVSYRIPKEERAVPTVAAPAPASTRTAEPGMRILPGMAEAAAGAGTIRYTVPEGWAELPPEGIRKANLSVQDASGSAEVTVLVFPGDVGGPAANIDRWRRQIGLEPLEPTAADDLGEMIRIAGHQALYVHLEGDSQDILAAILPFHGDTWFFKMQGDSATVRGEDAAMRAFLASVEMPGHTH